MIEPCEQDIEIEHERAPYPWDKGCITVPGELSVQMIVSTSADIGAECIAADNDYERFDPGEIVEGIKYTQWSSISYDGEQCLL